MSALGQKQTYTLQKIMSALPPEADMCSALAHICFGPKADIRRPAQSIPLGQLGDELHIFLRRPNAAGAGADIA
jgi:hypothetical protein